MSRFLYVSCVIAIVFSSAASALEIAYTNESPYSGEKVNAESLLLQGEIVPGDYQRLLDVIGEDKMRFLDSMGIILASRGGDVQEAMKIARLVKETYRHVYVGQHTGPCVSACFFIFSASPRRESGSGMLGIHRPYIHPDRLVSMSVKQAELTQKQALQEARVYLSDLGVPTNLIDKMYQHASTEVYWLTEDEVANQLGRRPAWYEQYLIANCDFDKAKEKKYFTTHDLKLLDSLTDSEACGRKSTKLQAYVFLVNDAGIGF